MSELFDKEVNAQKEKTSRVHTSSHKPTKKCAMKMKERRKNDTHVKMLLMEGSPLKGTHKELGKISDSGHNESTICLLNG